MPLTGRTCPWNTFAIWRVQELGLIGFPLIGDGTADNRACGGVEVKLHLSLFVVKSNVLLVLFLVYYLNIFAIFYICNKFFESLLF